MESFCTFVTGIQHGSDPFFPGLRNRKDLPGNQIQEFQAVEKVAARRLFQLYAAKSLQDLRAPGNALEALKDDRVGQHSMRIPACKSTWVRLLRRFGTSAEFWLTLQSLYDLRMTEQKARARIEREVTPLKVS